MAKVPATSPPPLPPPWLTEGNLTAFVRHTSCSLVIMENANLSARQDLHEFFDRLVSENTPWLAHTCEGPDDMPSHLRLALTRTSKSIRVSSGRMLLGNVSNFIGKAPGQIPADRFLLASPSVESLSSGL